MPTRFSSLLPVLAVVGMISGVPALSSPATAGGSTLTSPFYKPTNPKPKVRGSRKRVGGYSYSYQDSILDFRDQSVFLDPKLDDPSTGPFDSGFFFDSGIERHNNSPYLY